MNMFFAKFSINRNVFTAVEIVLLFLLTALSSQAEESNRYGSLKNNDFGVISPNAFACSDLNEQRSTGWNSLSVDTVYTSVDTPPIPPQGLQHYRDMIANNLDYSLMPEDVRIQGMVQVAFVVEKSGSLRDFTIVRDMGYNMADEVIKILKNSATWSAGKNSGKEIDVLYTLTVYIQRNTAAKSYDMDFIDSPPEPIGGVQAFRQWIGNNYQYPPKALENGIHGAIEVTFIVEKDGRLSNFNSVKDLGYGTADELIKLLKRAKPWKPGVHKGKKVRVKYSLPLNLNLS